MLIEIVEMCPNCDKVIQTLWDEEEYGRVVYCPYCGKKVVLCSLCDMDVTNCKDCGYLKEVNND